MQIEPRKLWSYWTEDYEISPRCIEECSSVLMCISSYIGAVLLWGGAVVQDLQRNQSLENFCQSYTQICSFLTQNQHIITKFSSQMFSYTHQKFHWGGGQTTDYGGRDTFPLISSPPVRIAPGDPPIRSGMSGRWVEMGYSNFSNSATEIGYHSNITCATGKGEVRLMM